MLSRVLHQGRLAPLSTSPILRAVQGGQSSPGYKGFGQDPGSTPIKKAASLGSSFLVDRGNSAKPDSSPQVKAMNEKDPRY